MSLWSVSLIVCPIAFGLSANSSVSRIPNSAGQLPGTTENLHLISLHLCFNQTEQTCNCSMFELFYVFRITKLIFVTCNNSTVAFGNKDLNFFNGMSYFGLPMTCA